MERVPSYRGFATLRWLGIFAALLVSVEANAFSAGVSGYSGKDGVLCDSCHTPTGFGLGTVTISGPASVEPGALASYTMRLSGGEAPALGFDLSASGGVLIDTNASGTRILNQELTHSAPIQAPFATITFDWRAPTTPGTYTFYAAELVADLMNGAAGDDTFTTTFTVTVTTVNQPPVAVITSLSTVEAGQVFTLNGRGSNDPDGTIVAYAWDFGDGTTGTGIQVDHVYATPGTYTVTLTVTDDKGATGTDTKVITVTAPAAPKPPVANAGGPYSGIVGQAIQLDGTGSTDPDGTIVSYAWDFGDGSTGTGATPTHAYAAAGVYTVTLTVTDNDGLTATATTTATIVVPAPPVADAGGPYSADVGIAILFDGSASMDPDGTIVSYTWDFGDGVTGSGQQALHAYGAPGTYTVTLTVTDNDGLSDTATATATIIDPTPPPPPPPAPVPPVANAGGPYSGITGMAVQMDGSGSSDPDGTIVSYAWDFGDGTTGTGVTPTHAYAMAGTYTVTLTVTDNDGLTASATTTATITDPPPPPAPPVADAGGPYSGTTGMAVQMDGSGSSDPDGTIVSYAWDFGDGTTGTGVTPTHAYAMAGTYTVTLTVTDNDGLTASATTTATITDPPPPPGDTPPGGGMPPDDMPPVDEDGARLYARYCAACHGGNGLGGSSGESVIGASPADIMEAIQENEGGMGALAGLTPEQIAAISRWLNRGIPDKEEKKLRKKGKKKYKKYCAACHGKKGTGGDSAGSIVGESREDILRAIEEIPEMQFLRDLVGDHDAAAIAEFLDYRAEKRRRKHRHDDDEDNDKKDDDGDRE